MAELLVTQIPPTVMVAVAVVLLVFMAHREMAVLATLLDLMQQVLGLVAVAAAVMQPEAMAPPDTVRSHTGAKTNHGYHRII
jgi:hypothetical protein